MLKAAAERGVEVRVIVYKEVKAALSCKLMLLNFTDLDRGLEVTNTRILLGNSRVNTQPP